MSGTNKPKQETDTPQSRANAATEKLYSEYHADTGKDSPEGKVNAALSKGNKAVKAMQETIAAIDGHADFVDIYKLTKIDIAKLGKGKNKEDIKEKLLRANYTGDNTEIHIWRGKEYRAMQYPKDTTKKSSGKKSLFNIASDASIVAANAIMEVASNGAKTMKDLIDETFTTIPENEYSSIHSAGTPDKVKEKIELIARRLSGQTAKGFKKLKQKGKKLQNEGKEYVVVDAPPEEEE